MSFLWDFTKSIAREVAIDVGISLLVEAALSYITTNSSVTYSAPQMSRLRQMMNVAAKRFRRGEDISQSVAGICALVAPGAGSGMSDALMAIFAGNGSQSPSSSSSSMPSSQSSQSSREREQERARERERERAQYQRQQQQRQQQQQQQQQQTQQHSQEYRSRDGVRVSGPAAPFFGWLFGLSPASPTAADAEDATIAQRRARTRELGAEEFEAEASDAVAQQEQRELRDTLVNRFGISAARVDAIPAPLRWSLLTVLEENPQCCISLEPRVDERTGRVVPGTVVLFQRMDGAIGGSAAGGTGGAAERKAFHAYLYEKSSIDDWFSASGRATNPVTRDAVDVDSQYFTLA